MGNINYQFTLSLLIIALGYLLKRLNIITQKDGETISKIIFNVTLLALIINTFSTIKIVSSLILLPIIGVIYGVFMCLWILFIFRKDDKSRRGLLSMALSGLNIGLFAYPFVEALWGENGLKYIAMFDIGNSIIVFVVCYLVGSYFSPSKKSIKFNYIIKTMFKSVPFLVYILSLMLNLFGLHLPGMVMDISKILSKSNMPLTLILLGVYLNFSFETMYWKIIIKALCTKYITGLLVGAMLYFIMPFDLLFRHTVLLSAILPIPIVMIPYAIQFNYDQKFIGTLINMTIIISFILSWLIFTITSIA